MPCHCAPGRTTDLGGWGSSLSGRANLTAINAPQAIDGAIYFREQSSTLLALGFLIVLFRLHDDRQRLAKTSGATPRILGKNDG
jgi:hypothetical protein